MKELIGKTITGLFVDEDQSILIFTHPNDEKTVYETFDDGWSPTWVGDITGVSNLLDSTVLEVEDVDLLETEDGLDYDEFYSVKLKTTKGYAGIVYRNGGDGYYGADIDYMPHFSADTSNYVRITDDWST